jgi:hypothetical protein
MDEFIEYMRNHPADPNAHQLETMARELVLRIESLPKEHETWADTLLSGVGIHLRKGKIDRQNSWLLRYADQEDWASVCREIWRLTISPARVHEKFRPGAIFEVIAHSRKLAGTNAYRNQTILAFEKLCYDLHSLLGSACEQYSAEQLKYYRDDLALYKTKLQNKQQELHDTKQQLRDSLSEVQKIKHELLDASETVWKSGHATSRPNVQLRALLSRLQEH